MTWPSAPMATTAGGDLEVALQLAAIADAITVPASARADLQVDTKPDRTWVTEADRQVEAAVRDALGRARPGDAVLGEEYGPTGTGPRRWIVDPIDGTANFVRRIPVWATLVGLEVDGVMTVGVVSAPALGRRWWAARGAGAHAAHLGPSGPGAATAIHVSAVADLADAQMSHCGAEGWDPAAGGAGGVDRLAELERRCWRTRGFGDFWSHVLVAEGACDIGLDPVVSLWDLAALQPIVEEAGGRFTDFSGAAGPDGGSAVSTNGLLHDRVLDIIDPRRLQEAP